MVKFGRMLLKEVEVGINKTLSQVLVCPLSKQPLRVCEKTNSLISDSIGVSYPIVDGIPCLVPTDGKIIDTDEALNTNGGDDSSEMKTDQGKSIFGLRSRQRRIKGPPPLFVLIKSTDTATSDKGKEGSLQSHSRGSRLESHEAFDEGERCCVCLSTLEEGDDRRLLPCLHEFHRECIDKWLIACRKTCPLCRFLLKDEEKTEKKGDALTEEMIMWFSSFHVAGF